MTQYTPEPLEIARPSAVVGQQAVGGSPESTAVTVELVQERVRRFREDHADLFKRMDDDQALFDLVPYNANKDGTRRFPSYTSNSPRTYAKKVVALLASAELFIRIPSANSDRAEQDRYDAAERFLYGLLTAGDERLLARIEPRIKSQLAWYVALRGYMCLRAVLAKRSTGETYVDIRPLDPRNAAWSVGYEGLEWAAYVTMRTAADLQSQYGIDIGGSPSTKHEVIDYYDRHINALVVEGRFFKEPTVHGAGQVPIYIVAVGPGPEVQNPWTSAASGGFGESIFAENRAVYGSRNQVMSIYLSLVEKARDRSYVLYSPSGGVTLQDNPNEASGVISLPSDAKLALVDLPEATKDSAVLTGLVTEEMHFGSLSKTSYGDVPFQLSGFAINSLRQSVFSILQPMLDAMQDIYTLALNGLRSQYTSGAYESLTMPGYDKEGVYISDPLPPKALANLPTLTVKLVAELPQDSIGNIEMAQRARTGPDGVPLLPDDEILDRIVGVQDVGAMRDKIREQLAERLSPRAMFYTLMQAAENRGRDDLAAIYYGELLVQQLQQMVQLAQAKIEATTATDAAAAMGAGQTPEGTGVGPGTLPSAARGVPPPTPTPQSGPVVPPDSERPGAQRSFIQRLIGGGER